jgi:quinol monooxygenase YgiN
LSLIGDDAAMVVVIGRVRTDAARREHLLRIGQEVARASREEAGCLGYRFYADTEEEDAYLFVEEWKSMDALREHFATDHIARFMGQIFDAIVGAPDVQVHDVGRTMTLGEAAAQA